MKNFIKTNYWSIVAFGEKKVVVLSLGIETVKGEKRPFWKAVRHALFTKFKKVMHLGFSLNFKILTSQLDSLEQIKIFVILSNLQKKVTVVYQ